MKWMKTLACGLCSWSLGQMDGEPLPSFIWIVWCRLFICYQSMAQHLFWRIFIFLTHWTRGFWDLNTAHKVGFFFSAFVNRLTNYVIRYHILIRKYDIIAMPPFPKMMHKHCKPIFWAPGWVLHKLDDTRIQINVSDRLLPKIKSSTCPSCLTAGLFTLQHHAWGWIFCLSTKALIQHDKNLMFRSSWCLVSCWSILGGFQTC